MTTHPAQAEGLAWIEERAPCVLTRDAQAIEARCPDGTIAGVVAFDCPTPASMQMHVAIEKPIAVRALMRAAWPYFFNDCGKSIAFGTVRASNEKALRFDLHIGFKPIATLKDGWSIGEDVILLELRREDCRWLEDAHG